jgi:hypothetical protein
LFSLDDVLRMRVNEEGKAAEAAQLLYLYLAVTLKMDREPNSWREA